MFSPLNNCFLTIDYIILYSKKQYHFEFYFLKKCTERDRLNNAPSDTAKQALFKVFRLESSRKSEGNNESDYSIQTAYGHRIRQKTILKKGYCASKQYRLP